MPKRDKAYMDEQRTAIARAALNVLLEKGMYETSMRDICRAAGVSIGSVYTHFATREEAIVAACALDRADVKEMQPFASWAAYIADCAEDLRFRSDHRRSRRARLSFQFVAELSMMEKSPPGLSLIYLHYRGLIERTLDHFHVLGEISLPLGLETTTEIHMQLLAGAQYQVAADSELDVEVVSDALCTALALSAGRTGQI